MPKFPPNTGFKMPGIGSKEINSPSNFRDDHHVDKMGYCDDTPDEMLPLGSSPLKYTAIIDDDPYTSVRGYDMSGLGEAIAESTKRKKKTKPDPKKELDNIQKDDTNTTRTKIVTNTPDKTVTTPGERTGNTGKATNQAWFDKLTPAQLKEMGNPKNLGEAKTWVGDYWAKKNTKTTTTPGSTTTVYKVNGKVVDKATWDTSASPNKTKETK
jgi:hypothetical protein